MVDLFKHHLQVKSAPFFVRITEEGNITDYRFAAGDWEEDTPESAAEHLTPYFADRSDKAPMQITEEMLCEKLFWDIISADFNAIKIAIEEVGCDPYKTSDTCDRTYLHWTAGINNKLATEEQVVEIAYYFLDLGLDINAQDHLGNTALYQALSNRQYDLAQLLIERGADVNLCDEKQRYPLSSAVSNNQLELTRSMLAHGAKVNAQDNRGRAPLHFVPGYDIFVAELLLSHDADINIPDKEGNTPFHYLLNRMERDDQLKLMDHLQLYVDKGADLKKVNGKGLSPLESVENYETDRPHHAQIRDYLLGQIEK
jgi:hypothetical protein